MEALAAYRQYVQQIRRDLDRDAIGLPYRAGQGRSRNSPPSIADLAGRLGWCERTLRDLLNGAFTQGEKVHVGHLLDFAITFKLDSGQTQQLLNLATSAVTERVKAKRRAAQPVVHLLQAA